MKLNERSRASSAGLTIIGALLVPFIWWLLKSFFGVSDRYLPSIAAVVSATGDLNPSLFVHISATLVRLIVGFTGGVLIGITIGISFSRWPSADAFFSPTVHALRAVPAAATVPFFLLWFGFSEIGRYVLVLVAVGLNVAVAARQILNHHSRAHRSFFKSFRLEPGALSLQYSLPRVIEEILPTLRFSLALSVGAVTVAELLGAQIGLGYLLQTGRSTFSFHLMFLAIIVIGAITSVLDFGLRMIWKRILFWKRL
jgi:ABC-type nitrate/sulfonate/bicarbonate transport system permease component